MFDNLEIEIIDIEILTNGGISIFARAWNNGVQIGFGKDGTVDMERFRFYNPPVLVTDPNGDIERSYVDLEGVVQTYRLREDPEQAILEALKDVISLVGKNGNSIIKNKIGNTTSTFYPAAGAVSPVDGGAARTSQSTWSNARDTANGTTADTSGTVYYVGAEQEPTTFGVYRLFTTFDTSSIGTDTIDSATLSIYGAGGVGSQQVGVCQLTLASTATIGVGDFDAMTINSAPEGATRQSYNGSAYNNFALNSTGLGWINKSGVTQFAFRDEKDLDNVSPPSSPRQYKGFYLADETGTSKDPRLVVEHSSGFNSYPMMHHMAISGGLM